MDSPSGKLKAKSPPAVADLEPVKVDEPDPQRALKGSIMVEKPTEKLCTTDKITAVFEITSICLAAATTVVVVKQSWRRRKVDPNQFHKRSTPRKN
ncbi:hypothetical protein FKW77_005403 [Venturia effusa]|uniref:Uncharacterized protein n=1 Tax=Venturia effusa TaxID=50376 RepID=A0A517L9B2_9PEZI|nr:hypothetical protein FKW77_005403 [Venturia effusa]